MDCIQYSGLTVQCTLYNEHCSVCGATNLQERSGDETCESLGIDKKGICELSSIIAETMAEFNHPIRAS